MARLESEIAAGKAISTSELTGELGSFKYYASLWIDPDNATTYPRIFRINSEVRFSYQPRTSPPGKTVEVYLSSDSFAKYAYFSNSEQNLSWISPDQAHGPLHTNDRLNVGLQSDFFNAGASYPIIFLSSVTSSYSPSDPREDGIRYLSGSPLPYNPTTGNPIPGRYEKIFKDGRAAFASGVKPIEMPQNSGEVKKAAWGAENYPSTTGVYVNSDSSAPYPKPKGGIYIVGDVDSMKLSVESGNSKIEIRRGSSKTEITLVTDSYVTIPAGRNINGIIRGSDTIVPMNSTMEFSQSTNKYNIYEGVGNGVIFCTGDIKSLSGTNKGKKHIAVDITAGKAITIQGNLLRDDTTVGEKPTGSGDLLGVSAHNIRLGTSAPTQLYAYAFLMAGRKDGTNRFSGSISVDNYSSRPPGQFRVFGGMIQATRTSFARLDSRLRTIAGYDKLPYYDSLALNNPPPYFPITGKLHPLTWKEK